LVKRATVTAGSGRWIDKRKGMLTPGVSLRPDYCLFCQLVVFWVRSPQALFDFNSLSELLFFIYFGGVGWLHSTTACCYDITLLYLMLIYFYILKIFKNKIIF
jgi:hypothetical protein